MVGKSAYAGQLSSVQGKVEVSKGGEWGPAENGLPVEPQDRIRTGDNASCTLDLDDGSMILIDENTDVSVKYITLTGDKHSSEISLLFGRILNSISKLKQTSMTVRTPTTVASVRGTEFAVAASSESATVGVFTGEVAVAPSTATVSNEVIVRQDEQAMTAIGSSAVTSGPLGPVMIAQKARLDAVREKVRALKERLKRVPSGEIQRARAQARSRFEALKARRTGQRKELRERNRSLLGRKSPKDGE